MQGNSGSAAVPIKIAPQRRHVYTSSFVLAIMWRERKKVAALVLLVGDSKVFVDWAGVSHAHACTKGNVSATDVFPTYGSPVGK